MRFIKQKPQVKIKWLWLMLKREAVTKLKYNSYLGAVDKAFIPELVS